MVRNIFTAAVTVCVFWVQANAFAAESELLVEASWLQKHIKDDKLTLIDTRHPDLYEQGHLPGAINLPVDDTFNPTDKSFLVAPISHIQKLFSQAGIKKDDHLVFYDHGNFIDAARAFWVFEIYGHQKLAILNMGYTGWVEQSLPISYTAHTRPVSNYVPTVLPQRLATKFSTRMGIENPDLVLVDVRTPEEYAGEKTIASRAGHIPNAINIPWDENLSGDGNDVRIVDLKKLGAQYDDLIGDRSVITYCNRGKQSALMYFVLRALGYNVAGYDGSWLEWGNDQRLPIIAPQETAAPAGAAAVDNLSRLSPLSSPTASTQ